MNNIVIPKANEDEIKFAIEALKRPGVIRIADLNTLKMISHGAQYLLVALTYEEEAYQTTTSLFPELTDAKWCETAREKGRQIGQILRQTNKRIARKMLKKWLDGETQEDLIARQFMKAAKSMLEPNAYSELIAKATEMASDELCTGFMMIELP